MKRKSGVFAATALTGLALFGIVITSHGINGSVLLQRVKAGNAYALNLNTSNRITSNISSATEITQRTVRGSEITFEYSNCNSNSSYHAIINNGGTIINTDSIGGITGITPVFTTSGQLKMRAGYSPAEMGAYVTLKSGQEFVFDGDVLPNFVELSASGSPVSLASMQYEFECEAYTEESYTKVTSAQSDYSGTYLIVDDTASLALVAENSEVTAFDVSIKNGKILKTSNSVANQLYLSKNGDKYYIDNKDGDRLDYQTSDGGKLFWDGNYSSSLTFSNGTFEIKSGNYYFFFETDRFTYRRTSVSTGCRNVSLYKANFESDTVQVSVYSSGISATDTKASKYFVGETFDSFIGNKGLNVNLNKSDGSYGELSSSEYTYEIKDGNTTISSSSAFTSTGTYTVNIYYGDYFSTSYEIIVNEAGSVSEDYTLVTDVSDLEAGQSAIIVGIESGSYYAISKTQNNNNRSRSNITVSDSVATIGSDTAEFELQTGNVSNTFAFYDDSNSGYLYAASSSKNYLRTESSLSNNSSFAISINGSGEATITAQGSNSNNTIKHNTNDDLFSCYANGQQPVYIYAKGTAVAPQVAVESVTLDRNSLSFEGSGEYTLTATVLPANATNKELTWSTSDDSVAAVTQSGAVSAVGVGTATITATSKADSTKTATCTVTVSPVSVSGVTLNVDSLTLYVGDSSTLTATVSPSNATNKDVTWSVTSANPAGCVSVNNGTVQAVSAGSATITVDTNDGHKKATCSVTVNNRSVSSITFTSPTATVKTGKTVDLSVTVSPSTATIKTLNWNSSDTSVATLSNTSSSGCTVTGVSAGTSVIRATATDGSGVYGECTVTVQENTAIDTWTLVTDANTLQAGDVLVLASNANGKTAGDISSNVMGSLSSTFGESYTTISELNEDSTILTLGGSSGAWTFSNSSGEKLGSTAVKNLAWDNGTTTWTISISGGDATIFNTTSSNGRFLYNVNSPRFTTYATSTTISKTMALPQLYRGTSSTPIYPTEVSLSGNSTIAASETTHLSASFTPVTANQTTLQWSSSNTSVATVDSTGLVTGVSAGNATITAKAKASASDSSYSIVGTFAITVTPIASVEISDEEISLTIDQNKTLTATVNPSNAPNKNVTWTVLNANPNGCVTVLNGVVTGVAEGTATVKVYANADSSKYATCAVTVTSSGSGGGGDSGDYEDATMTPGSNSMSCTVDGTSGVKVGTSSKAGSMTISIPSGASSLKFYCAGWSGTSGALTLTPSGFTISPNSITPTADSGISGSGNSYSLSGDENSYLYTFTLSNVTSNTTLTLSRSSRFAVWGAKTNNAQVEATGVTLENIEVSVGGSKTITPTISPAGANYNTELSWSKVSGANTISVNSSTGEVSVTDGAIAGQTATIKAELINVTVSGQHPSGTCTVTVVESQKDAWTLMFYVCGSNLESDGGAAKKDLQEILSKKSSQPDNVNIIVETGGATSWKMPNVKSDELGRWEIDKSCTTTSMRKVDSLTNANMGDQSTFQSFLEWGVNEYPADRYGVFMWDHGAAMDGCCFDDKFESASNGNGLLPYELSAAATAARSNCHMGSDKFEFIAYDACLMAVQDIALWNARDFNYQLSSQETEWDGGYDYDEWLPTLYANPTGVSTVDVLKKIADTFMAFYASYNDQTQSVYDLSQMAAYKTAFDAMTDSITSVVNSSSKWSTFTSYVNQALKYGYNSDDPNSYNNGYPYDIFDVKGVMEHLKTGYSSLSSKFQDVIDALNDVVIYNRYHSDPKVNGSCGMNLFCPLSGYNQRSGATYSGIYYPANYTSSCTLFSKWQAFVWKYGTWAN